MEMRRNILGERSYAAGKVGMKGGLDGGSMAAG